MAAWGYGFYFLVLRYFYHYDIYVICRLGRAYSEKLSLSSIRVTTDGLSA